MRPTNAADATQHLVTRDSVASLARPAATLVDLLDRVLDRGLVVDADIIITLAGVPLIGIKLRAALAGMETMVQYGVMRDWDQRLRAQERAPAARGRTSVAIGGLRGEAEGGAQRGVASPSSAHGPGVLAEVG